MSRRTFKPGLIPTVVTLLMFVVLLTLGTWQISRSHEKQTLLKAYEQAPALPAVNLDDLEKDWQSMKYRQVVIEGHYDSKHQVLLENQLHVSEYGFIVLTPFYPRGRDDAVLVNRGWIKRADTGLPEISVDQDDRVMRGLVSHAPGVGMQLGTLDAASPGWPKQLPYIDLDWMSLQLGVAVKPWVILLDVDGADGFTRSWKPALRMGPEKHQGYAFQWYTLALVLIFLFVAGSLRPQGEKTRERRDTEE